MAELERKRKRTAPMGDQIPPIGGLTLSDVGKHVYVDKTNLLGRIMAHREAFISAPSMRRCGKSIAVSLLKAMAEGDREALGGMDICSEAATWNLLVEGSYAVICVNFAEISTIETSGATNVRIARYLHNSAADSGITSPTIAAAHLRF
jgi:hypothetical protein